LCNNCSTPWRTKSKPKYTWDFNSYCAENTFLLGIKNQQFMLFSGISYLCPEINTKHVNGLCGQDVGFLNPKSSLHKSYQILKD
jgi:hypothetical protein